MSWNYYPDAHLRGIGISSCLEPLGNLVSNKMDVLSAYCTSYKCTKDTSGLKRALKVVDNKCNFCPDCKGALIWKKSH